MERFTQTEGKEKKKLKHNAKKVLAQVAKKFPDLKEICPIYITRQIFTKNRNHQFMVEKAMEFRKENLKHKTKSEAIVKRELSKLNMKIYEQCPIFIFGDKNEITRFFIADFLISKTRTIVEVDGGYHSHIYQYIKDEERTDILEANGFRVVRIDNEDAKDILKLITINEN